LVADTRPTIPCLFWSCRAAYEAAAVKLVRLHSHVDPVSGPVNQALLKKIKHLTGNLRQALCALGAFVGWLPLDECSTPGGPPRKESISKWITYQQTYRLLGPDAAFWYDRLERGIVMFDVSSSSIVTTTDNSPLQPRPATQRESFLPTRASSTSSRGSSTWGPCTTSSHSPGLPGAHSQRAGALFHSGLESLEAARCPS
jgi:hypothetical protein